MISSRIKERERRATRLGEISEWLASNGSRTISENGFTPIKHTREETVETDQAEVEIFSEDDANESMISLASEADSIAQTEVARTLDEELDAIWEELAVAEARGEALKARALADENQLATLKHSTNLGGSTHTLPIPLLTPIASRSPPGDGVHVGSPTARTHAHTTSETTSTPISRRASVVDQASTNDIIELRNRIAEAEIENELSIAKAKEDSAYYREELKQAMQERDIAHDHMLLLRERWLQGYDELGGDVDLKEISAEYHLQVESIAEHQRLLRSLNTEFAVVSKSSKSTYTDMQAGLVAMDAGHQDALSELESLQQQSVSGFGLLERQELKKELKEKKQSLALKENAFHECERKEKEIRLEISAKQSVIEEKTMDLIQLQSDIQHLSNTIADHEIQLSKAKDDIDMFVNSLSSATAEKDLLEEQEQSFLTQEVIDTEVESQEDSLLAQCYKDYKDREQLLKLAQQEADRQQETLEQIVRGLEQAHDELMSYFDTLGFIVPEELLESPEAFAQLNAALKAHKLDLLENIASLTSNLVVHSETRAIHSRTLASQNEEIKSRKQRIHAMILSGQSYSDGVSLDDSFANMIIPLIDNEEEVMMMVAQDDRESLRALAVRLILDLAGARRHLGQDKQFLKDSVLRHWTDSNSITECPTCAQTFGLLRWRYHCRVCGGIFCGSCTKQKMRTTVDKRVVRCCTDCYEHTLRAQKLRSLQKKQIQAREKKGEVPLFQDLQIHICYSTECRMSGMRKCYSPTCRYKCDNNNPSQVQQRAKDFQKAVLIMKERYEDKPIELTGRDLWELVLLHRVPTERWLDFIYDAFEGTTEYQINLVEAAANFADRMDVCDKEETLQGVGAEIKVEVNRGLFDDRTVVFLRYKYGEVLHRLRGVSASLTTSPMKKTDDGLTTYRIVSNGIELEHLQTPRSRKSTVGSRIRTALDFIESVM
eukprot:m.123735 g.123735  ORF g.123735 m.123735 type:complete len:946 (+) comp29009_c1_seq2:229-3066(+)